MLPVFSDYILPVSDYKLLVFSDSELCGIQITWAFEKETDFENIVVAKFMPADDDRLRMIGSVTGI